MFLKDIVIIDLKRSQLDTKKSDPAKGKFAFVKKVPIAKDLKDANTRPEYHFTWVNGNDKEHRIDDHFRIGYDFLEVSDPYYPEGASLKGDGHWWFDEMVLMKVPMKKHLQRMLDNINKSNKKPKQIRDAFKSSLRDPENPGENLSADISDEQIDRAFGGR